MSHNFDKIIKPILGVTPGQALSDAYVTKANDQTRLRMMYASRRLADLMVQIYGSSVVSEDSLFLQWTEKNQT